MQYSFQFTAASYATLICKIALHHTAVSSIQSEMKVMQCFKLPAAVSKAASSEGSYHSTVVRHAGCSRGPFCQLTWCSTWVCHPIDTNSASDAAPACLLGQLVGVLPCRNQRGEGSYAGGAVCHLSLVAMKCGERLYLHLLQPQHASGSNPGHWQHWQAMNAMSAAEVVRVCTPLAKCACLASCPGDALSNRFMRFHNPASVMARIQAIGSTVRPCQQLKRWKVVPCDRSHDSACHTLLSMQQCWPCFQSCGTCACRQFSVLGSAVAMVTD